MMQACLNLRSGVRQTRPLARALGRFTQGLALAMGLALALVGQESRPATVSLVILHTNDVHGQLHSVPDSRGRGADRGPMGGYQELVTAIDEERSKVAHSVLVDAGDWFQGTPEGTLSRGRCAVELMNAAGYDFAAIGNHDFDCGQDNLADLLELARFRPFARNLSVGGAAGDTPSPATRLGAVLDGRVLTPQPVVVVDGFRVAFDGLLSEETPRISSKRVMEGLGVGAESDGATRAVLMTKGAGKADALVLVNHVGKDNNVQIARDHPEIDVVIGGHNHRDVLESGVVVESTGALIAQAAANSQALGIVTLEIDPVAKKIVSKKARLRHIAANPAVVVPRIAPIIERHEKAVAALMDVPVANVPVALTREWTLEKPSPLASWMTQVMIDRTHADVAIHNAGGIRAAIPAGAARVRELFQVSPFGNRLVVIDVTAKDVREVCERSARNPSRGCHIRGIEVHWTQTGEGPVQVTKLVSKGKVLSDGDRLRVATTDFLAGGADNFPSLRSAAPVEDLGITLLDATLEAARSQKTVTAPDGNAWVRDTN